MSATQEGQLNLPRFNEIDALRGIACLSVVVYHYLSRGPRMGVMPGLAFEPFDVIVRYGYLGVHLFFMISGFVILLSVQSSSARDFFASRASRLYPAFWAGVSITALLAWIVQDSKFHVYPSQYLINLSMLPAWFSVPYVDGAYWTLTCELHFYILMFMVLKVGVVKKIEWVLAGWLIFSLVNIAMPHPTLQFWLVAPYAPLFVAGATFYLIRALGFSWSRFVLIVSSFAGAEFYAITEAQKLSLRSDIAPMSIFVVGGVIAILFLIFIVLATGKFHFRANRFTRYAGMLTYPLYVVHENVGFMLYGQVYHATNKPWLAFISMVAMVFFVAWAIFYLIERPFAKPMRQALMRRKKASVVVTSHAR